MRRDDDETDAVGRAGLPFRPGVAIGLMMAIAVAIPGAARGDEPGPVDRVGQRVVARFGGLMLRDDRDAVIGVGEHDRVYRVERVDGRRLWLRAVGRDLAGWAPIGEVEAVGPPEEPAAGPAGPRSRVGFGTALGTPLRRADVHAHLRHAEAAAGRGEYSRAIAKCTEAIRLDPKSAEAYYVRGTIWAAMQRMDQALIDFDEAIRIQPRQPSALVARAEVRMALKDDAAAIADLDQAIRLGYRDAMAYYDRGRARHRLGQYEPALADLDEAIRRDPRMAEAFADRAYVSGAKGDIDRAIDDLDEAIRLDPQSARYHLDRSRFRQMKNRSADDGVLADLDEAIRLAPANAQARVDRATIRHQRGRFAEALADCGAAIRLDPRDATAYFERGQILLAMSKLDPALADFDEAIRLDPRLYPALLMRSQVWRMRGQPEKAEADIAAAGRIAPREAAKFRSLPAPGTEVVPVDMARGFPGAFGLPPGLVVPASPLLPGLAPSDAKPPKDGQVRIAADPGDRRAAVVAAARACERDGWKDAETIEALAKAHADAGDLDAAARVREAAAAARICGLTGWTDPEPIQALAAACAGAGAFDAAVRWQARANAMFADPKAKAEGEARLKLYRARAPYRQGPTTK